MKAPLTRIKEETKKRTENSKHYFNNDGSYTAEIFGRTIHYKDRNNQWQDIDTTVVISDDPNYDFMNITNSTKIYFKKEISGATENVKIVKNDSTILIKSAIDLRLLDSFSLKIQKTLNKIAPQKIESNKIKFLSVYKDNTKNIDIDYYILSDKLHEEFVINEPMEFPEISQEIILIDAYYKLEGKSVYIYNKTTNKIIGILPPPVMFEKNNPLSVNYDLHYEIVNLTENTFIITKVLEEKGKEWFFSSERTYSIIVDTDFQGTIDDGHIIGSDSDYTTARNTATNFNTTSTVTFIGQNFSTPTYTIWRAFLKFNTSSIGISSVITQVNLTLTMYNDNSTDDFAVRIHNYDWSGTDPITSGNKDTAYDEALISTYDADWKNTLGIVTNTNYISSNLSTSWINKVGTTYYSLLSSRDINNTTPSQAEYIRIYTQENTTSSYRPFLSVTYTTPIPEQLIIVDNY